MTTNENGNFTIQNLPPGSFNITANILNFNVNSNEVILEVNTTSTTTFFLNLSPGSLTGTVINEAEQPIGGCWSAC